MIFNELRTLIAKQFKIPETAINEDTHIYNDLKFDSLDAVELIITIEETYNLELLDADAENVTTITDLIELINTKRA